jgi:hypothetical protein
MKNTLLWVAINILCIISTIISQFSLFWARLFPSYDISLTVSLIVAVIFMLTQLLFMIPYIQLGMLVLTPVQLVLLAVGWTFVIQLIINEWFLGEVNTIDDYIGIVFVFLGIFISKYRVFI